MTPTLDKPQELFVQHMRDHPNVLGFLAMGLGKTLACLYFLDELLRDGAATAALVIAPLRVTNLTWPMEVATWFPWMKVANLRTESGQRAFLNARAHLYVINFEAIPTLVSLVERRKYQLPYDVAIFDELTRAKNPSSKRINLFRRKVPRVARQIGLTGTPLPNSSVDIFAQARLVDGGERLGRSFTEFKQEYFHCTNYGGYPKLEEKAGTAQKLEKKLSEITLTLKSSDWLNIPDTVIEDIEIAFPKELMERYRTLEKELVIELRKDKTINIANSAALITKLLQFTSGEMYDDEKISHWIHDLKFDALKKVAAKEESPLLVTYMYKHEEGRLRQHFPHAKHFSDTKRSSAEKTIAEEKKLLEGWNAGKIRMVVASPASISHGLNMQYGANALAWPSLTYNREHYEQTIGRFARRGQTKVTKVYRLIVPGTVDDAVASAIETKQKNEQRLVAALQALESYRDTK